jgi:formate dehydrogenase maturation protein FdhE
MAISTAAKSPAAEFERRGQRAELLARETDSAREPLLFASALCREQSTAALAVEQAHLSRPLTGRLAEDATRILPLLAPVVRIAAERGPEDLAAQARHREGEERSVASNRLIVMWSGDSNAREDYLSRAMLRPYVEVLRAYGVNPDRLHRPGHCPFCAGAPLVSSRKELRDSNAAARMLHCGFCGCEWNAVRGSCPSCEEDDPAKLPIFTSDAHPLVRIEACETCGRYVKSVDLTQDARMIPEIDDLVSLSMDLWAVEQGLTRIEPGLAGM